jgi:hypothetical protein
MLVRFTLLFLRLKYSQEIDVFLSHDWPQEVYSDCTRDEKYRLLRRKRFFKQEFNAGILGNPATALLVDKFAPKY